MSDDFKFDVQLLIGNFRDNSKFAARDNRCWEIYDSISPAVNLSLMVMYTHLSVQFVLLM